jgi:DUF4097 and DUF4098 domain-containing protein YvlB
MSKNEYLDLLKKKLAFADEDFVKSLIADFEAHFEAGKAEGLSETEIISHLGDIDEIVESLDSDFVKSKENVKQDQHTNESKNKVNHVVIDAKFADVVITPSLNGKVEVNMVNTGTMFSKFTNSMIGEQKGDVFEIRVIPLLNVSSKADMKISVTIPAHLQSLKVLTSSGDLEINNIALDGNCSIKTASGDVTLIENQFKSCEGGLASGDVSMTRHVGDIIIKTASGDVLLEEGRGDLLDCVLASGELTVNGIYQKVKAKTVSGDMNLKLIDVTQLDLASVNGDGLVHFIDIDSIKFVVSAVSGHCVIKEGDATHKLRNKQEYMIKDGVVPCFINTVNGEFEINMG